MTQTKWIWIKAIWIAISILVLAWWLRLEGQHRWEEQIMPFYAMNALSFPSGLLFYFGYSGLAALLAHNLPDSYMLDMFLWLGFFATGYFQWFKLVPLFTTRLSNRLKLSNKKHE